MAKVTHISCRLVLNIYQSIICNSRGSPGLVASSSLSMLVSTFFQFIIGVRYWFTTSPGSAKIRSLFTMYIDQSYRLTMDPYSFCLNSMIPLFVWILHLVSCHTENFISQNFSLWCFHRKFSMGTYLRLQNVKISTEKNCRTSDFHHGWHSRSRCLAIHSTCRTRDRIPSIPSVMVVDTTFSLLLFGVPFWNGREIVTANIGYHPEIFTASPVILYSVRYDVQ